MPFGIPNDAEIEFLSLAIENDETEDKINKRRDLGPINLSDLSDPLMNSIQVAEIVGP